MNDNGIADELIQDILTDIKILYTGDIKLTDNMIKLYIKAICTNILIKTNRRQFVPELKYIVIDLVMDKIDSGKSTNDLQSIQSMSEYDRTVTFGTNQIIQAKLNLIAQKQLDDNEKLINRFRLLYKT